MPRSVVAASADVEDGPARLPIAAAPAAVTVSIAPGYHGGRRTRVAARRCDAGMPWLAANAITMREAGMETTPITKSTRRVALATLLLLLVPLTAMQFTGEVNWGPGDFVVAGLLLFGAGMLYVLAAARCTGRGQRAAVAAAVCFGLAIVWAELAVGLFH